MAGTEHVREYLEELGEQLGQRLIDKSNAHINTSILYDYLLQDISRCDNFVSSNPVSLILSGHPQNADLCVCPRCISKIRRYCDEYYQNDIYTEFILTLIYVNSEDDMIWGIGCSMTPRDIRKQILNLVDPRQCEGCGLWDEICRCGVSDSDSDSDSDYDSEDDY